MIRRIKAKLNKVPYLINEYWQASWVDFNSSNKLLNGCKPIIFSNDAKIGEVIPLLKYKNKIHFYKIISDLYAPGSDHIVSPRKFNFKYVKTASLK